MKNAMQIVDEIERDFTDRRGLRQEWEQFDDDIKDEIRDVWSGIIAEELHIREKVMREVAEDLKVVRVYIDANYGSGGTFLQETPNILKQCIDKLEGK